MDVLSPNRRSGVRFKFPGNQRKLAGPVSLYGNLRRFGCFRAVAGLQVHRPVLPFGNHQFSVHPRPADGAWILRCDYMGLSGGELTRENAEEAGISGVFVCRILKGTPDTLRAPGYQAGYSST